MITYSRNTSLISIKTEHSFLSFPRNKIYHALRFIEWLNKEVPVEGNEQVYSPKNFRTEECKVAKL